MRPLLPLLAALALMQAAAATPDLVIRNVRVVHGDGRVTARATVVVHGRRIRMILPAAVSGPVARRDVDAAGRTLLPGLVDAHVHVAPWAIPLLLRSGVTTVRDLHDDPTYMLPLARESVTDRPFIVAAGALVDGAGTRWRHAIEVASVGDVRAAVRRQVEAGAGVIAVHERMRPVLVGVAVEEARARGVTVAAHLGWTHAVEAAAAGVASIERLSGVAEAARADPARRGATHDDDALADWTASQREWTGLDAAALERVARAVAQRGTAIVPTLALHDAFSRLSDPELLSGPAVAGVPREIVEREWAAAGAAARARWTPTILAELRQSLAAQQRFVATFARVGGKVVAGTDAPQPGVVPGASLHRELLLYVAAGMSPAAAIRSATADAAALLGVSDRAGTIDAGKDADLVLVDGDPLQDIRATARIRMVVRLGRIVGR